MRFTVVTIFPEMFDSVLDAGMLGRARQAGHIAVDFVNPREFTSDRHRTVDDTPYGGGPGMVMKVEPVIAAIEAAAERCSEPSHRILLSPAGAPLTQTRVRKLADMPHLVLVCGRYEGMDERVSMLAIDEELSIGDYVLTGGELGAMTVIDAVSRHVPGVLGEAASAAEESFSEPLLEYPHYTRPLRFRDLEVPEILLSGHHANIAAWRRTQSLRRTARRRPDVLAQHHMSKADEALWAQIPESEPARGTYVALVHHPVYDRTRAIVTTAITNFDLHDIARSASTYGLGGYFVITPVAAQREKVDRILSSWRGGTVSQADNRIDALASVETAPAIADVIATLTERHETPPLVVATSARPSPRPIGFGALAAKLAQMAEARRPTLLLMGTGWGLSDEVIELSDLVLAPICGRPAFNHLSVRSAAAVVLDRLFGLRDG